MKNLNIKLAENFKVNIGTTNFGFKISNEKKEQIKLFANFFFRRINKAKYFSRGKGYI